MEERLVVGAAVLHEGRLLAARRARPPELAGRWELPGGKVEPGEGPDAAVVREVAEELGCVVAVEAWLPERVPVRPGLVLEVARAHLRDGEPRPGADHDEVRWLGPEDLHDVDWLEPDRPFLPALVSLLREGWA